MKHTLFISSMISIVFVAFNLHADVGVPINGFPNWTERMVHVLVNRARSDPAADLAGCEQCSDAHCYTIQPPLTWNEALARAARFHATNLTDSGCSIQHDSPCELVDDIGSTYPWSCDGSVSCACVGGVPICGFIPSNTSMAGRVAAFGYNSTLVGENIASGSPDPFTVFYLWLWEATSSSTCGFTFENGHRYSILSGHRVHIGVGQYGGITVQEFGNGTAVSQKIPSGSHYPQSGSNVEFRANWHDLHPPTSAEVNINGTLHTMMVERGIGGNATYLFEISIGDICTPYYFRFTDSTGGVVTYPSRGAFGINCIFDWAESRPGKKLQHRLSHYYYLTNSYLQCGWVQHRSKGLNLITYTKPIACQSLGKRLSPIYLPN